MEGERVRSPTLESGVGQWPKIAIIILNWNGWRDTLECLESVERLTYPNYQVVLVDNGSADDSVDRIREWVMGRPEQWGLPQDLPEGVATILPPGARVVLATDRLTLIRSDENLGFAGGCNLAIDFALARDPSIDFVFLLNNDAQAEPNCLKACVAVAEKEDAAIVGALIKSKDGQQVVSTGSRFPAELFKTAQLKHWPNEQDSWPVDRVEGAGMLVRRDLLNRRRQEVGRFLETSFFMYGEEVELCIWAKRQGFRIVVARQAVVRHRVTAASGGEGSPLAYYYITRNRVHLARRLLPKWTRMLFHLWYPPSRLIRAIQRALQGRPEVSKAILHGLIDGYRGVYGKWDRHPEIQGEKASKSRKKPVE
jgi:GT2 family glycosyltransferase